MITTAWQFPDAWSHKHAGGYAFGHHSCLWTEMIAADNSRRSAASGPIDRATATRSRDEVLARCACHPAAESGLASSGRDADPQAMLVQHGLISDGY